MPLTRGTHRPLIRRWHPLMTRSLLHWSEYDHAYNAATTTITDRCAAGDGIYTLRDLSRNGVNLVQATSGARPAFQFGPSRAEFGTGGNKHFGTFTFPGGAPAGLFTAHVIRTSSTGYHNVFDHQASSIMLWVDSSGRLEMDITTTVTGSIADGVWRRVCTYRSPSVGGKIWVNGVLAASGGSTRTPSTTLDLYARAGGSCFKGDSAFELIAGGAEPSSAFIKSLDTYMQSRLKA